MRFNQDTTGYSNILPLLYIYLYKMELIVHLTALLTFSNPHMPGH